MLTERAYYLMNNGSVRDVEDLRREIEKVNGHSPCADEIVVDDAILHGTAKGIGIDHKMHFDEAFFYMIATRQRIRAVMLVRFHFPEKSLSDAKYIVEQWMDNKHWLDDKF